jgi:hypothetical protein
MSEFSSYDDVLAIHDPCFARMQFEIGGPEAVSGGVFRLASALSVKHSVIGVPVSYPTYRNPLR